MYDDTLKKPITHNDCYQWARKIVATRNLALFFEIGDSREVQVYLLREIIKCSHNLAVDNTSTQELCDIVVQRTKDLMNEADELRAEIADLKEKLDAHKD